MNQVTSASLRYPLSVFNKNSTLNLRKRSKKKGGDVSLRTNPPPPLEWISSPPLVSVVLIITKGDESPDSSRMGVIGALVIFFSI